MIRLAFAALVTLAVGGCAGPAGPVAAPADPTPITSMAAPTGTAVRSATTAVTPTAISTPSGPQPDYHTAGNPIDSGGGLSRVACALPAWPDNAADLAVFFAVAAGCLDRAWQPVLARLNLPFRPAAVQLVTALPTGQDTCAGQPENNSYYCAGVIYLDQNSYLDTSTGPRGVPAAAIGLLAHEYGHHIQQLAGLLPEAGLEIGLAGREAPNGLQLSRRVELQAECFAGMFVGATFDPAGIALAQADSDTRGDQPNRPADHGVPKIFGGWFATGVQANTLTACDTWAAPAAAVR